MSFCEENKPIIIIINHLLGLIKKKIHAAMTHSNTAQHWRVHTGLMTRGRFPALCNIKASGQKSLTFLLIYIHCSNIFFFNYI